MDAQNEVERISSSPAEDFNIEAFIGLVIGVTRQQLDANVIERQLLDEATPAAVETSLSQNVTDENRRRLREALNGMIDSDGAVIKTATLISLFKVAPIAKEILRTLFHGDNPQQDEPRPNKDDIFEAIRPYLVDMKLHDDLNEVLKGCHMSQTDIIKLYEFTTHYILPTSGAEKFGFVYWVETGRSETLNKSSDAAGEGKGKSEAKKEADTVCSWMKGRGYQLKEECDWDGHQLEEKMAEHLGEIKEDCSVVVVFVMAHGSTGSVYGADNKPVSLDAIDKIILTEIPAQIPKVLVVQACQRSEETAGADGKLLAGELENAELNEYEIEVETNIERNLATIHVTVQEPNCNADGLVGKVRAKISNVFGLSSSRVSKPTDSPADVAFARVRSAAAGEIAWRNIFIPAFISQLKANKEFKDAFHAAADELDSSVRREESTRENRPIMRSTSYKKLHL